MSKVLPTTLNSNYKEYLLKKTQQINNNMSFSKFITTQLYTIITDLPSVHENTPQ